MTLHADTQILNQAEAWIAAGHGVALATVVQTWGSAPRPAGSLLAMRQDGTFLGSVSGGCVEAAVIAEAQEILIHGRPKLLTFGVSNETAWAVGLACGGQIAIWVERVSAAHEP